MRRGPPGGTPISNCTLKIPASSEDVAKEKPMGSQEGHSVANERYPPS